MFKIDEKKTIHLTRGDIADFIIKAKINEEDYYQFQTNDVITLAVYAKGDLSNLKLKKVVEVIEPAQQVSLSLTSTETKIDEIINKPVDYWYEIQLNNEQTIIGYDEDGAKIFKLYPEGE